MARLVLAIHDFSSLQTYCGFKDVDTKDKLLRCPLGLGMTVEGYALKPQGLMGNKTHE
jgi:hypothetical protein